MSRFNLAYFNIFTRAARIILLPQYRATVVFLFITNALLTIARPRVSVFIANAVSTAGVGGILLIWLVVAAVALTMVILSAYISAMTIKAAAAMSREERLTVADLFGINWQMIGKLLIVYLIYTLSAGLGLFLLLIPGVLIFVWWYFAPILVVVENLGIKEALKNSRELSRRHFWQVGVRIILIYIAYILPQWFIGKTNGIVSDIWTGTYPYFSLLALLLYRELTGESVVINSSAPDKLPNRRNDKLVVPKR